MSVDHRPLCSVCIANYNGIKLIDACIRSVQLQDCDFPVEIIVHDDASTDSSVEHLRLHYPKIVLILSKENVGFCVSNNRMVERAQGHYILLLNNDAELFHDALRTLYNEARRIGSPAVLGLPQYNASTGELIDIGSRLDPFLNPVPNLDTTQQEVGMIIGACLWLQRDLWHELGGFPDWFGSLAEDMYLCLLARLYGYPVIALPVSGFRHWVGQSLGGGKVVNNRLSTKLSRRIASERNKTFVMALIYPNLLFQIIFPLHLILLLIEGLLLAVMKRNWSLFVDIYWGCVKCQWSERKRLNQLRKKIQMGAKIGVLNFLKPFNLIPYKLYLLLRHGLPEIR